MSKFKITLFLFLFAALFSACSSSEDNKNPSILEKLNKRFERKSKVKKLGKRLKEDNMSQFAEDKEFKDKHPKPTEVTGELKGEMISFDTPDGKTGSAYAVMAKNPTDKFLFVIQEWWGLNDNVKKEADKFSVNLDNVNILALDMYDGKSTDNPDEAGKLMGAVVQERAESIIKGALNYAGDEPEIATVGWCFGGGWSLRASILAGESAKGCVMYYGLPVTTAAEIAPLEVEVLGIFAEEDKWINREVISAFEKLSAATGKKVNSVWFEADHAFANPSSPRYNEEAAMEANALALEFLRKRL